LKRRKARDTTFWLGVDTGLAQRIAETELKKKGKSFFIWIFLIIGREKNPMNLRKKIRKYKQGVAQELGRMIVIEKKQKKSGKKN
jgi:hypothetical protein